MSADEIRRALQMPAVEVQVAAAERCRGYAEDGVGWVLEFGVGAVFDDDLKEMVLEGSRLKGIGGGSAVRRNHPCKPQLASSRGVGTAYWR